MATDAEEAAARRRQRSPASPLPLRCSPSCRQRRKTVLWREHGEGRPNTRSASRLQSRQGRSLDGNPVSAIGMQELRDSWRLRQSALGRETVSEAELNWIWIAPTCDSGALPVLWHCLCAVSSSRGRSAWLALYSTVPVQGAVF